LSNTGLQEHATLGSTTVESTTSIPLEWPVERVVKAAKRRLRLRDLVNEAPIVRVLAARDLKVKYKQSVLGPLWLVFQPLALLAGFVLAFKGLAGVQTSGVPYALFALVGLSVWSFFQAALMIGAASLLTNMNFIRYTPCPRPAFPLAAIIASLPSYAVTAGGAVVAAAAAGWLSPRVVLLPLALLWLLLLTLGVVAIASSTAVRYRDVNSALPFLLQVGVFFAPVGYSLAQLSPTVRDLVYLNPLTGIIEASRWMVLSGYTPSRGPIVVSLAATLVVVIVGWQLFSRREPVMADEI
jgi:ABC-type polysaccharide/polyol phosphate export permease